VAFDAAHEPCRSCRMVGSNGRFAAQIVSDSREPLFFDDLACLRSFLLGASSPVDGATYFVDHRTGEWVAARQAVFSRNERIATPMSSHLLAHATAESREADPDARGGTVMSFAEVFEGVRVPGGGQ
jgi:copper chaperone NosL